MTVTVVDHPLAQSILTMLRDRRTGQIEFRKGLVRLGRLMGYEVARSFPVSEVEVETPLGVKSRGVRLEVGDVVIIQILRAAMPMVEGLLKVFPMARMGVISARRREESHERGSMDFEVEMNYVRIPRLGRGTTVMIVDPMLATGSTMLAAMRAIEERGEPGRMILINAIGTRQAVERILAERPVDIYLAAIDPEINGDGYIVPGLGDAGDRAYGEA